MTTGCYEASFLLFPNARGARTLLIAKCPAPRDSLAHQLPRFCPGGGYSHAHDLDKFAKTLTFCCLVETLRSNLKNDGCFFLLYSFFVLQCYKMMSCKVDVFDTTHMSRICFVTLVDVKKGTEITEI